MINTLVELYTSILSLDKMDIGHGFSFGMEQIELKDFVAMKFKSGDYVYCNSIDSNLFNPIISPELYKLLMNSFKYYEKNAVKFTPIELYELIILLRTKKLSKI